MVEQKKLVLKTRGKAISRAIDVVEVVRHRFLPDLKVSRIGIGTDQLPPREGYKTSNVSTIEITLKR